MKAKKIAPLLLVLGAWLCVASQAAGAPPVPVWRLTATSQPTNFAPGEANDGSYPLYEIVATNVGGAATSGQFTITDTLPPGIAPTPTGLPGSCTLSVQTQTISCPSSAVLAPSRSTEVLIRVEVGAPLTEGSTATSQVKISGGGAANSVDTTTETPITPALPDFGVLTGASGISGSMNGLDGSPVTLAGAHPDQLTVDLGFTSRRLGGQGEITGVGGGVRDLRGDAPPGFVGNPQANSELCSEAQLEGRNCPKEAAIGVVSVLTTGGGPGSPAPKQSPLYSMVPPAGMPAEFGFDAAGIGIFVHLKASVRSDSDYGISLTTNDALSRAPNPVLAAQLQLWGDPSDPSHNGVRGECDELTGPKSCPVGAEETAFLALPSACSQSLTLGVAADSWASPGDFHTASALFTDANGAPTAVEGCEDLEFKPTIEAKPTTDLADSASGLDVRVHQPQTLKLKERYTASLKDATLTLPEGLTVNPSQADGLAACSEEEIGFAPKEGQIHFTKEPAGCPDAAKIGSVSVDTPLLDHPVPGALYIAKPFQNPFGSLLALYLSIDDAPTGTVAKLAGLVHADPLSGQLSTTFTENPELPLEDIRVHLFAGNRAALRTPPACATYTTTAQLTPWSSPQSVEATDSFPIAGIPGGGACPTTPGGAPNAPSFEAGTVSPQAGTYSPFAMRLARADGSQPPTGFEATLPPGLVGKVAGVPYCPEAAIARARSRSNPEEGRLEQADPSCPAAAQIGSVDVGAGAGPTPFHTTGRIYLAGPYKGAPLSAVAITPAVAGPFDLGTVVVRAALYLDPERAQVRTVSDPLPTILYGIPLDVRSVALRLGRSQFTLNPTNCDEMSIGATLTSLFGNVAPLSNRFQVGGCRALDFKPRLSLRLKGKTKRTGHPALTGVFRPRPGQANAKRLALTLPRSEFLDQAHIGTVCTRVQFAANQCPAASVYGHAMAITPLLDQPLEGPVYLRSSSHELPDVVIALHGQVDAVLDGRVDSVNGGIRVTFETLPDAPVTKAVVRMKGGDKGLLINSVNLCRLEPAETRATLKLQGQNAKRLDSQPVVQSDCGPAKESQRGKKRR